MAFIIASILAPLTLLTLSFAVEVFAGIRPLRQLPAPASQARAVIVVPAHDEEAILSEKLKSLKAAAGARAQILVVADNCSDATAQIAKRLAIEVIERVDLERRGKGFALDFARSHLKQNEPEVVLIVDADCTTDAESIDCLIRSCAFFKRPCQATYLLNNGPRDSLPAQLSSFAFFVKNVIRQRGVERLAGRAHLLGTGMAFPWHIFSLAQLATDNIVEDLKLGQELAAMGHPPIFIEGAVVWSAVETDENTLSQRRRWEGGFIEHGVQTGPRMLVQSLWRIDLRGLWAAINLMIPPIALLVLLDVAALAGGAGAAFVAGSGAWPVLFLAAALTLAGTAIVLAWRAGGSRFVPLANLALFPSYLLWKLPLYLGFIRRGAPTEWVRTERD